MSIRWRILLAILLIVGLSFAVMAQLLTRLVSDNLSRQRIRQDTIACERLARSAAPLFVSGEAEALRTLLTSGAQDAGGRVLLTDAGGKIHCDSAMQLEGCPLPVTEVAGALTGGETMAGLHPLSGGTALPEPAARAAYADAVAAPLMAGDAQFGALLLIVPVDEMIEGLLQLQQQMLKIFMAVAVAAMVFALLFSHLMTRPITEISAAIRKMERGDLSSRVPVHGRGELQELAVNYNAMAEQLEQLDKSRSQFVSNASHELKTPLATLKILLETVLYQPDMPVEVRTDFLGDMDHEIDRLSNVVTDLLTLTRMDNRSEALHLASCSLTELTEKTVRRLMPVAEQRHQQLTVQAEPGITLQADGDKLTQVFYNLTENALKYTPDGGHVQVRLRRKGHNALWSVTDDGVGIPQDDLTHIFERFYRVDKARSRETGGTGLGLSIVRQLVKLHGGTIGVESTYGYGSTFTVTLPLAADKEAEA